MPVVYTPLAAQLNRMPYLQQRNINRIIIRKPHHRPNLVRAVDADHLFHVDASIYQHRRTVAFEREKVVMLAEALDSACNVDDTRVLDVVA